MRTRSHAVTHLGNVFRDSFQCTFDECIEEPVLVVVSHRRQIGPIVDPLSLLGNLALCGRHQMPQAALISLRRPLDGLHLF